MINEKERILKCPRCGGISLTLHSHSTAYTVTDYYGENYEIFRCDECRFEFSTSVGDNDE